MAIENRSCTVENEDCCPQYLPGGDNHRRQPLNQLLEQAGLQEELSTTLGLSILLDVLEACFVWRGVDLEKGSEVVLLEAWPGCHQGAWSCLGQSLHTLIYSLAAVGTRQLRANVSHVSAIFEIPTALKNAEMPRYNPSMVLF